MNLAKQGPATAGRRLLRAPRRPPVLLAARAHTRRRMASAPTPLLAHPGLHRTHLAPPQDLVALSAGHTLGFVNGRPMTPNPQTFEGSGEGAARRRVQLPPVASKELGRCATLLHISGCRLPLLRCHPRPRCPQTTSSACPAARPHSAQTTLWLMPARPRCVLGSGSRWLPGLPRFSAHLSQRPFVSTCRASPRCSGWRGCCRFRVAAAAPAQLPQLVSVLPISLALRRCSGSSAGPAPPTGASCLLPSR